MAVKPHPYNDRKAVLADRIFDGTRWHHSGAVLIGDGRVRAIVSQEDVPKDWPVTALPANAFLAPGFIDLQVNGGGGVLLNDAPTADAMRAIARAHRRFGTTACLPTFITDSREKTLAAIAAARTIAGCDGVLGLHLEGPFINPKRAGIHRAEFIVCPEMHDLDWLGDIAQTGRSLITLAPECAPAGFVRGLVNKGIRVSAGHSEATVEQTLDAVSEGLTGVTHLFNAMPPLASRSPGLAGAALADPRLVPGIIADGLHVHPVAIRAAFAAKGPHGIALVTDAMPTVGATEIEFDLMGRGITLENGRLADRDGTLAGAHLDMGTAVRNAVVLAGIPLEEALRAASSTPAQFLGLDAERGSLHEGACADMVAISEDLKVIRCWAAGLEQTA